MFNSFNLIRDKGKVAICVWELGGNDCLLPVVADQNSSEEQAGKREDLVAGSRPEEHSVLAADEGGVGGRSLEITWIESSHDRRRDDELTHRSLHWNRSALLVFSKICNNRIISKFTQIFLIFLQSFLHTPKVPLELSILQNKTKKQRR